MYWNFLNSNMSLTTILKGSVLHMTEENMYTNKLTPNDANPKMTTMKLKKSQRNISAYTSAVTRWALDRR
jgi:hypothetical protein